MTDTFILPIAADKYEALTSFGNWFKPEHNETLEFEIYETELKVINEKLALIIKCMIAKGKNAGEKVQPQNIFLSEAAAWKLKELNTATGIRPSVGPNGLAFDRTWYINRRFSARVEFNSSTKDGKTTEYMNLVNLEDPTLAGAQPTQGQQLQAPPAQQFVNAGYQQPPQGAQVVQPPPQQLVQQGGPVLTQGGPQVQQGGPQYVQPPPQDNGQGAGRRVLPGQPQG